MIEWGLLLETRNMRKIRVVFLAALTGACLFFLFERAAVRAVSAGPNPPRSSDLLERVINLIRNDYLEEKEPIPTMDGSFKGLVNSLDAGCSYLNAESTARYQSQKGAALQETGVILYKRFGSFPQIIGLVENSPAAKAGIEIDDSIAEINGAGTAPMSLAEVYLYLDDAGGTAVNLKIIRDDKTLEFKTDRALLFPRSVDYKPQAGTAGILRVYRLTPSVPLEIKARLASSIKKQKGTLVLDLRDCSEGSLDAAWQLVNLFLKADNIGYLAGRGEAKETVSAPGDPVLEKTPLVIWVNRATIGPAEAAAGVLRDFARAKVVGLPTLGLVAREDYVPLEDGTSVLLTSGVFCLRSGAKLWGQGVSPDAKIDPASSDFGAYLKKTNELRSSP